jgi:hypothetical protein
MSLKDGAVPFMPKIITYKQLGFSELGTNLSRSYLNNGNNNSNSNNKQPLISSRQAMSNSKETSPLINGINGNSINGYHHQQQHHHHHIQHHHLNNDSVKNKKQLQHHSWSPSSQNCNEETTPTVINEQKNSKLVLSSRSAFSECRRFFL